LNKFDDTDRQTDKQPTDHLLYYKLRGLQAVSEQKKLNLTTHVTVLLYLAILATTPINACFGFTNVSCLQTETSDADLVGCQDQTGQ